MQKKIMRSVRSWQLPLQTTDLVTAFMIWVIISTLLPFIKEDIFLSHQMTAWVTAIPVILGSVLRIPFGYLAGRFGSRIVYLISFTALLFPLFLISEARSVGHLLIGGMFLGIAGAIFSVGVTSLPKYYPDHRQGFVNGIYGLGNIGTALTTFGAPSIAVAFGWQNTIKLYLILTLLIIVANIFLGDRHEKKLTRPIVMQLKEIITNPKLWILSLFYFVSFGAFVAFTMVMPNFFVNVFSLEATAAGFSIGIFIVLASIFRVAGGWIADRRNPYTLLSIIFGVLCVCIFFLVFISVFPFFFAILCITGIMCGLGNGVVFKIVPTIFKEQVGVASGFVAMMGGLGGFFPPLILAYFLERVGWYGPALLLCAAIICVCFILALTEVRRDSGR